MEKITEITDWYWYWGDNIVNVSPQEVSKSSISARGPRGRCWHPGLCTPLRGKRGSWELLKANPRRVLSMLLPPDGVLTPACCLRSWSTSATLGTFHLEMSKRAHTSDGALLVECLLRVSLVSGFMPALYRAVLHMPVIFALDEWR